MQKIQESPNNHIECLTIYENMTYSERRIANVLSGFQYNIAIGSIEEIYPSIDTIAKKASCCKKSVNNFIAAYENILFKHQNRRRGAKNTSNKYNLHCLFFEWMIMMRSLNWLKYFNGAPSRMKVADRRKRIEIVSKISGNDHYLVNSFNKLCKKKPRKLRYEILPRLRSTKSSFLSKDIKEDKDVLRRPKSTYEQKKKEATDKKNSEYDLEGFENLGLLRADQERLKATFATFAFKKAKEDLVFYSRLKEVRNTAAFLWSRAKAHTYDRLDNPKNRKMTR